MIQWGINSLNHGSSIAVFEKGKFKSLEVFSDDDLPSSGIHRAFEFGKPDEIYWYEQPWVKKARQLYAKQYKTVLDMSVLPSAWKRRRNVPGKLKYTPHHASHAAAGYYTSPFNHCAIVVLDAIGEWECASIWEGKHGEIKKVWSRSYPNSLGLFYSAFTKLVGLEPIKQEFLLQQMSDNGDPLRFYRTVASYTSYLVDDFKNMHRGILDWPHPINNLQDQCDIAAAVQLVFELQVEQVMEEAHELTGSDSLVYMGGCAMNSKANKKVVEPNFDYIWSLPYPGDPSSAMGAVLYHTKQRVWDHAWEVKHIDIRI